MTYRTRATSLTSTLHHLMVLAKGAEDSDHADERYQVLTRLLRDAAYEAESLACLAAPDADGPIPGFDS